MSRLPIVIISAPQGTGKTRNADTLMRMFGCTRIVDDWDGQTGLRPGTLALTNCPVVAAAEGSSAAQSPDDLTAEAA